MQQPRKPGGWFGRFGLQRRALEIAAAHERALIGRLQARVTLGNARARSGLRLLPRILGLLSDARLELSRLLPGKLSRLLPGKLSRLLPGKLTGKLARLLPRELTGKLSPWELTPRELTHWLGRKRGTDGPGRLRRESRQRRRPLRPRRTRGRPRRFRRFRRPRRPGRAPVRQRPGLFPRASLKFFVEVAEVSVRAEVRRLERGTPRPPRSPSTRSSGGSCTRRSRTRIARARRSTSVRRRSGRRRRDPRSSCAPYPRARLKFFHPPTRSPVAGCRTCPAPTRPRPRARTTPRGAHPRRAPRR